jgi:RNA polymerase sigma factor (sigma-70 family)
MATTAPEISVLARDRAFESLYRRYVKDVYHYSLALLRNPADAEDVTQTTFLNAYRAYSRGVEVEKPQNWLIKIAHNVARTRYARASRRVKEVPLEDHVEQLAVPEENKPDVQGVLEALGRLPFNQRAAIVMRELEGRSYGEIADTLGVSVSAVETLIFRARRSLRLKASAVRALAVVPVPSSLTQLFGGGAGLVAGGGGVVAGGFIGKAAVAIVAGLIATGVSSDRTGPAGAAHDGVVLQQGSNRTQSPVTAASQGQAEPARASVQKTPLRPGEAPVAGADARGTALPTGAATTPGALPTTSPGFAAPPVPTKTVETVTGPGESVVSTTEQVVSSATSALPVQLPPALPVPLPAAPSLPSVPVQVPPVPGPSPLP